ncbi:hypothetical protein HFP15_07925 [Amycolatopsis sp. K13G38]|uniref:Glycosyl hydrolases family 39 N-terminal catalytic domain-containing protein n=1 Tax=Amycolatopsis acididurans TaxID=2724524 RepID=A0ABX1IZ72_9PSEU|nr:hypothetical protein [Amycolatopsis acididurans]NKQ52808.1 hypothetical protein [Amycolatopsis acididurans]
MVAVLLTVIGLWLPSDGREPAGAHLLLGVTHAQYSLDPDLSPEQRAAGERVLATAPMLQNQHIMGWGALNPEPSPGVFDWSTVDTRMDLISRTGGVPVLTLCCAPDWMKGGSPGTTDWNRLEEAPAPEHYGDFAALAAEAAKRYPQVRYFQVWNELKGFWDAEANTWDSAGFTDFYNQVYDAVKRVRPDARIGGPYVVFDTVGSGRIDPRVLEFFRYWNEHKHGADFAAVDASTGPGDSSSLYADVTSWVRAQTGLPVWWSEFYPHPVEETDQARAAATLDAVARAAEAGASAMLLWQPQASADLPYAALWSDPSAGPVGPTSLTRAWTWLAARLRTGSVRIERDVPGDLLRFVGGDATLTVNLSASASVRPGASLAPFAITFG